MTNWRITFPIEKAEQRDDGYFIIGLASGPEIDATDERMDQNLVYRYADQINASGGLSLDAHLPYRDAHAPDGVMRDLGWLTSSWINDDQRLAVEVKLDEENPAAMYLFRQLKRGKKYGMSVAGKVLDYVDEWVTDVGKTIRTYKDVILTEISNTTRPAWTPSFGSVLAKAISDDGEPVVATGSDTPAETDVTPKGELMPAEGIQDAQKAEETAPVVEAPETAIEPVAEAVEDTAKSETEETTTEKDMWDAASASWTLGDIISLLGYADSPNLDDLRTAAQSLLSFISSEVGTAAKSKMDAEKAAPAPAVEAPAEAPVAEPVAEAEKSEPDASQLFELFKNFLKDAGVVTKEAPEAAAQADSQDTENPETAPETPAESTQKSEPSREELEKSVVELTAKVAELESSAPTVLPPVVERQTVDAEDFNKSMNQLPRDRRLAAAFAAKTNGR